MSRDIWQSIVVPQGQGHILLTLDEQIMIHVKSTDGTDDDDLVIGKDPVLEEEDGSFFIRFQRLQVGGGYEEDRIATELITHGLTAPSLSSHLRARRGYAIH
jgi:hypothetical protein